MTATVHNLPAAAASYITVRKYSDGYHVEIVQEIGSRSIRTALAVTRSRSDATDRAFDEAQRLERPVKLPGGAA